MDIFTASDFQAVPDTGSPQDHRVPEEIGRAAYRIWTDLGDLVAFVGELSVGVSKALVSPHLVRWKDTFRVAEVTGVNALPIITLVSFLVGLIMSFQAAIPMQLFGATIYVANLIALSMVRELGPLMTAIVLAGRSGSAFAAEIGTMKVNEEIDALTTMGLGPGSVSGGAPGPGRDLHDPLAHGLCQSGGHNRRRHCPSVTGLPAGGIL